MIHKMKPKDQVKNKQAGFGLMGVLLLLVTIGLIAGLGYVVAGRGSKQAPATATKPNIATRMYTDSSKLYSLAYPDTWTVKEAPECCEGAPKDYSLISRSVEFIPPGKDEIRGYSLSVQANTSESLAKEIERVWAAKKQTPQSRTVNGYDALYVKAAFNADAESYIDHNYLVTHNQASVFLTFREKYYHEYPKQEWSAAQDVTAFNKIVESIKFLQ